jgi:hypothetical protein
MYALVAQCCQPAHAACVFQAVDTFITHGDRLASHETGKGFAWQVRFARRESGNIAHRLTSQEITG